MSDLEPAPKPRTVRKPDKQWLSEVVGKRIRSLRESRTNSQGKPMTQQELADALANGRIGTVQGWERGSNFKISDLALLCDHFGVSSDNLLGLKQPGDEEPTATITKSQLASIASSLRSTLDQIEALQARAK